MSFTRRKIMQGAVAAAILAASSLPAFAAEVGGIKFPDTVTVAGQELVLNGAGVRSKLVFKVYALGFYLKEKKTTVAEVLASGGPRRIRIMPMRDLTSDDFGMAFMKGLNDNVSADERTKLLPQTKAFGEMFAQFPGLKKGDELIVDWTPGVGSQATLNGKKVGEVLPDVAFFNAIMRIWIGDKPVDATLKPKMLVAPQ
ncbi:lipoprotein transmembrane [Pseudoduganella sp. DS3]|uniref:Lipoprotein transmembrane n=1 Tax=Pseudoduganella guangdongensis TaxID=2692179 RepID=A0A6N9HC94_9BURK|nr:chalcone isomerase family protein [Pseudoduganella guangdongensis]MYN01181.1 lipoprotein transmembrane [Pseudoduganella guangdongensis]